jgi:predicted PurR-regulated permease PerM
VDPRSALSRWLPHALLLTAFLAALLLLALLLAPLAPALALLSHPLLMRPLRHRLSAWWPRLDDDAGKVIAAGIATALPLALLGGVLVLVLWATLGQLGVTVGTLWGVLRQDQAAITAAADALAARAAEARSIYTWLPLDAEAVRAWVIEALGGGTPGQAFIARMLGRGGGAALEVALIVAVQFTLLVHGDRLGAWLRSWLVADDAALVAARFRHLAHHLLTVTGAHAVVQGVALALLAWAVGGFNPVLVGVVAIVLGLMPLVGHLAVWGPLAGLLWSQGRPVAALALAAGGLAVAGVLWWAERGLARRRGTDDLWLGLLIFLALAGGLVAIGWRGLAVGPAAVLLVATLGEAVRRHFRRDG